MEGFVMLGCRTWVAATLALLGSALPAAAVTIPGGGPAKKDCLVVVMAEGVGFPAGKALKGSTCADGNACDGDGVRDGVCRIPTAVCVNASLPGCSAATVNSITLTGKQKGLGDAAAGDFAAQVQALQQGLGGLGLPTASLACTGLVELPVYVQGPDGKGQLKSGRADLKVKAKASGGKDNDKAGLVCLPNNAPSATTTTVVTTTTIQPTTTSTTTAEPTTSTTTTLPPPPAPGAGLEAAIQSVTVGGDGTVVTTFTLTDEAGVPITPSTSSTSDPNKARVRFTIAHLDEDVQQTASGPLTYTEYLSYVLGGSGNPGYDSGGTLATVDPQAGVHTYTFKTKLPGGFPASFTHTVGGQVDRPNPESGGPTLRANPIFDFVPAGGPVTTVREPVTTTECNQCHNPLAIHGGGRREIELCQLCHTKQLTGGKGEFRVMVHKIHRGRNLPSVVGGAVGDEYEIGGHVYSKKVEACVGGALAGLPCEEDADCPSGTCSGTTTLGVGFPKDLRRCDTCHHDGTTATHFKTHPGTRPCTACHDTVNPSVDTTAAGPPGWNHIEAGASGFSFPENACVSCHTADDDGELEPGVPSIPGVHTVPERSEQLGGLETAILDASGTSGNPVVINFSVKDKMDTPIDVKNRKICSAASSNKGAACTVDGDCPGGTCGFEFTVRFVISGPQTDFGGAANPDPSMTPPPFFQPSAVGTSVNGVLGDLAMDGTFTFTTNAANSLPASATGTWRVGLEVRHTVYIDLPYDNLATSVTEAAHNVVRDFSVDGSDVEPRRMPVETAACEGCHSEFSYGFSLHGNLRNQIEYCVLCHNPNKSDFDRRKNAIALGGDTANQTINLKHVIHKLHRGEEMADDSYLIYGFGSAPLNFTPHDFKEIRFPGNLADCGKCHTGDSYTLPLPDGVLPTRLTGITGATPGTAVEVAAGSVPAITDACTSCHDSAEAFAHAETNTTSSGAEACTVCHGEGSVAAVSEVHARHLE
jgi:OmcA/MtrC family decaheme c-type cytochrome